MAGFLSTDSMEEILASLQSSISADIKAELGVRLDAAVDKMDAKLMSQTASILRKYDISAQARFSSSDEHLAALDEKFDEKTENLKEILEKFQKSLARPPARLPGWWMPPSPSSTGSFADRLPDPSVLKITAKSLVLKQDVVALLDAWLVDANIDKQFYEIRGDSLGRHFSIKFEGDHGSDRLRSQQAFGTLRSRAGVWRKFAVVGPSGTKIDLFIGKDKSQAQIRGEIGLKRLLKVVQQALPLEPSVHLLRREKQVAYKWQPLVRLDVEGGTFKLKWNDPVVSAAGVDRVAIDWNFRLAMGANARSQIKWCSLGGGSPCS